MDNKKAEYQRRWRLKNLERIRVYQRRWQRKNKEKIKEYYRNWRTANMARVRDLRRKWKKDAGPQYFAKYRKANKQKHRYYSIKHRHGLSKDAYDLLLSTQSFRCAACEVDLSAIGSHNIHVDHCHKTQKIRAILCGPCNRALGLMKDDPVKLHKLAEYITRFK